MHLIQRLTKYGVMDETEAEKSPIANMLRVCFKFPFWLLFGSLFFWRRFSISSQEYVVETEHGDERVRQVDHQSVVEHPVAYLRYFHFDWDDQVTRMPAEVHLHVLAVCHTGWTHQVDVSNSEGEGKQHFFHILSGICNTLHFFLQGGNKAEQSSANAPPPRFVSDNDDSDFGLFKSPVGKTANMSIGSGSDTSDFENSDDEDNEISFNNEFFGNLS